MITLDVIYPYAVTALVGAVSFALKNQRDTNKKVDSHEILLTVQHIETQKALDKLEGKIDDLTDFLLREHGRH